MNSESKLFPETYEASRDRFRGNLARIQAGWPEAHLAQHTLSGDEDLTIDWIQSPATRRNEKVFLLTTGEHGIEGFVGSAMQQRFIDQYLPKLDPATTGIVLVHAINPWGMKNRRRVNAHNIDLNRNFVWDSRGFDPEINPEYDRVKTFLNPGRKIQHLLLSHLKHYLSLALLMTKMDRDEFRNATLLGQYRYPECVYYGGKDYEEETRTVIKLYRDALSQYDQILHLDMHTGYGPRYQMSLVNSVHETRSSADFVARYNYPLVVAATGEEFYAIQGDMVDYFYSIWKKEFPAKRFYSGAFEFGTVKDILDGIVHSPRAMILENQCRWNGAANETIRERVAELYQELFNPQADDWRKKALADADQAFEGILRAEGYL